MKIRKTVSLMMAMLVCMTSLSSNAVAAEDTFFVSEAQDAVVIEEAAEDGITIDIADDSLNISDEPVTEDVVMESVIQEVTDNSATLEDVVSDSVAAGNAGKNQLGYDVYFRFEDAGKTLVIYGSGEMWDLSDKKRFKFDGITRVIIENGVTTTGYDLFSDCTSLKEVSLPESLEIIEPRTFAGCTSLKEVSLPESLTTFGNGAFYGCTGLNEVILPKNLTTIAAGTFEGCTSLKKVSFPDSLTTLRTGAFYGCTSLKEVSLPNSLKTIDSGAFYGCTGLKEVNFPESMKTIGSYAFVGCPIEMVDLPVLDSVESQVFGTNGSFENDCPHEVGFREGWKNLNTKEIFSGCNIGQVSFPQSLETLGSDIFNDCTIDLVIFKGKPSRDPSCSSVVVPGKRIVFPGTEEEWNDTGLSKSKDAEIYYDKQVVTVTLNSRGSSIRSLLRIQGEPLTPLPEPDQKDPLYVFDGWYLDEELTQPVVEGETTVETDATIYAKWQKIPTCHVSFYLKNEAGEWTKAAEQEIGIGQPVTVPEFALPKGYSVQGYYTDSTLEQTCTLSVPVSRDTDIYVLTGRLDLWKESITLQSGKQLSVSFGYTGNTEYDSRKHVLSVNPVNGTEVKANASQNPDIEIEDFTVTVDGEKVKGITLKSCSCKNNLNAGEMQLIPAVAYDGNDAELKQLLMQESDLKTALGKVLNPKYNKQEDTWTSNPIMVNINHISLSSDTEVYNLKGMTKDQKAEIAKKDGVLVWNGKNVKIKYKTRKEKGEETAWNDDGDPIRWGPSVTYYIPVRVEVPGLYYQRIFDLGNGKTVTKKIKLKAGGWSLKSKSYSEEGEKYTDRWMEAASGACDYYCSEPDTYGYEKDDKPTSLPLVLNTEGRTVTKTKTKKVKDYYDDEEKKWYYDYETDEWEVVVAKPSNFVGELPSFGD